MITNLARYILLSFTILFSFQLTLSNDAFADSKRRVHTLSQGFEGHRTRQEAVRDRTDTRRSEMFAEMEEVEQIAGGYAETVQPTSYALASPGMYTREVKPYIIGNDDLLEILVWGSSELTQEVSVGFDGNIDYGFLGKIRASGRSLQELGDDISARLLQGYLKDPKVKIEVKEFNSKKNIGIRGNRKTRTV